MAVVERSEPHHHHDDVLRRDPLAVGRVRRLRLARDRAQVGVRLAVVLVPDQVGRVPEGDRPAIRPGIEGRVRRELPDRRCTTCPSRRPACRGCAGSSPWRRGCAARTARETGRTTGRSGTRRRCRPAGRCPSPEGCRSPAASPRHGRRGRATRPPRRCSSSGHCEPGRPRRACCPGRSPCSAGCRLRPVPARRPTPMPDPTAAGPPTGRRS